MKLSKAIRTGAKLRGQARGTFFDERESGEILTDALGAAFEAAGIIDVSSLDTYMPPDNLAELLEPFDVSGMEVPCPVAVCGHHAYSHRRKAVHSVVIHLTDYHCWSREGIAAWLERYGC